MGLFSFLLGLDKDNKDDLEKEMDWHNLDDYEKEEVCKGNYDVYNFEDSYDEVELDEDDYYSDNQK